MSRAFVKEDVDPPERSGRRRSASGLPPGATNYITARGAARLRAELTKLRDSFDDQERIAKLEEVLASLQIVDPPEGESKSVPFGATVTVEDATGKRETYTVVGTDELKFEPHAVSWVSSLGKALLSAELGDRITLTDGRSAKIVKVD
jgi:transcription elongation GreA/GreB family factor